MGGVVTPLAPVARGAAKSAAQECESEIRLEPGTAVEPGGKPLR
ncbi:hypothetical protein [uncultured Mobiluncus sp.]|nr:hypothetical protein [uncultured Mobiluncus sp.]